MLLPSVKTVSCSVCGGAEFVEFVTFCNVCLCVPSLVNIHFVCKETKDTSETFGYNLHLFKVMHKK